MAMALTNSIGMLPSLHIQRSSLLGLGTSLVVRNLVISRPSTSTSRHTTGIGRESALQNVQHQTKDGDLRPVLEKDIRVPKFVREYLRHGAGPVPVDDEQYGKDGLQKGPGEEEQVARDGDPYNALHLTFGRDLIDRTERFEDGTEPMAEDGNLTYAHDGHGRQEEGIDQDHPLRRIDLGQKEGGIQYFHQDQTGHQR